MKTEVGEEKKNCPEKQTEKAYKSDKEKKVIGGRRIIKFLSRWWSVAMFLFSLRQSRLSFHLIIFASFVSSEKIPFDIISYSLKERAEPMARKEKKSLKNLMNFSPQTIFLFHIRRNGKDFIKGMVTVELHAVV